MDAIDFKALIENHIGDDHKLTVDENSSPKALLIAAEKIESVCAFLRDNPQTYFDLLSCLTAIDNGPEANTMEVIYNLYSIPLNHSLMLKTSIMRDDPKIDSISHIWKTANWHERETYDLFGITFNNHPDLRRILMPADWEGYPMRKDYEEPETYRGMKTIRTEQEPS